MYDLYVEEPQVCRGLATTTKTLLQSGVSKEEAIAFCRSEGFMELNVAVDASGAAFFMKNGEFVLWQKDYLKE